MPDCLLCNPLPVSFLVPAIKRPFCVCNQQLQRSEREYWADSTLVCERDSSLQKDAWCTRKCDFFSSACLWWLKPKVLLYVCSHSESDCCSGSCSGSAGYLEAGSDGGGILTQHALDLNFPKDPYSCQECWLSKGKCCSSISAGHVGDETLVSCWLFSFPFLNNKQP